MRIVACVDSVSARLTVLCVAAGSLAAEGLPISRGAQTGGRNNTMNEQINPQSTLASVEADIFGALIGFHLKTMKLLQQSSLNNEKLKLISDRIETLLANATADLKQARQQNLTERLEAAFNEISRFVDELSSAPAGSNND